jgi:DegT/DnrJ/EryC1/StrS aminotransferase family
VISWYAVHTHGLRSTRSRASRGGRLATCFGRVVASICRANRRGFAMPGGSRWCCARCSRAISLSASTALQCAGGRASAAWCAPVTRWPRCRPISSGRCARASRREHSTASGGPALCLGEAGRVPSLTFAATAEVVAWLGKVPVFVGVVDNAFRIDWASHEASIGAAKQQALEAVAATSAFMRLTAYGAIETQK